MDEIYIATKCGESDTTTGLGSCPTVGVVLDRLIDVSGTASFGETSELTGAEHVVKQRATTPEAAEAFMHTWNAYNDFIDQNKTFSSSAKQTKHLVAGLIDVPRHRLLRGLRLALLQDIKDLLVANPAWDFLCADRVEASHVTKNK
jgi:(2R)-sulfolactate sulfo-lyase subunit beta